MAAAFKQTFVVIENYCMSSQDLINTSIVGSQ